MTDAVRRRSRAPRKKQADPQPDNEVVPVVPGWVGDWGPALLIPVALVLLIAFTIGVSDGAPWGGSFSSR